MPPRVKRCPVTHPVWERGEVYDAEVGVFEGYETSAWRACGNSRTRGDGNGISDRKGT